MVFFPWNVMDGVHEAVHAKSKLENTWWRSVELFGGEKRNKRLVVCLDSNGLAQDVIDKFFTCPGEY